jgi:quercetin dioxygenase-like cupin family protein
MKIVDESKVEEKGYATRWLIGAWNSRSSIDFGIAYFQPNKQVKKHIHEQVEELFYVIEGEIHLQVNNETSVILKRGQVAHVPPPQAHSLYNRSTTIAKLVIIKFPSIPSDKKYLKQD